MHHVDHTLSVLLGYSIRNRTYKPLSVALTESIQPEALMAAVQPEALMEAIQPEDLVNPDFFEELYTLAEYQDVQAITWPVVSALVKDESMLWNKMPAAIREKWASSYHRISRWQIYAEKEMQRVYAVLHANDIDVIPLKGEALRKLYPYPETRSMGDVDILVRKKDFHHAKNILIASDYKIVSATHKHVELKNKLGMTLELHEKIVDERFDHSEEFSRRIWDHAVIDSSMGDRVYQISPPMQMLYLLMHLSSHLYTGGCWLRQICDIVIYCESVAQSPEFPSIRAEYESLCREAGLENISASTLHACSILLDLDTERLFPGIKHISPAALNAFTTLLIHDGRNSESKGNSFRPELSHLVNYYSETIGMQGTPMPELRTNLIRNFLFPTLDRMPMKYEYAKKRPYLLPLAWLHRFAYGFIRKDIPMMPKVGLLLSKRMRTRDPDWLSLMKELGL